MKPTYSLILMALVAASVSCKHKPICATPFCVPSHSVRLPTIQLPNKPIHKVKTNSRLAWIKKHSNQLKTIGTISRYHGGPKAS